MRIEPTWSSVEQAFADALAVPEAEREMWVRGRPGLGEAARDEVLAMLRAHERMGSFLESPALDFRGQSFGRYRAMEEVGRGGMSIVYRGERIDGDFEKEVAIKVLLLQSLEAARASETQILARLEHPNVARLLDSGLTAQGFRYLVIEFVRGEPVTQHASRLAERERLMLFLQVCAGVQAAHRAMVVHRDLKPDNILVTPEGLVKLLDFGIAKLLAAAAAGPQTTGLRAFTPDYASPEQILGEAATPASDIYSLGILLCELLSGRKPRALSGLPLGELVEVAGREVDSVPLTGDLAAIARKALERNPGSRYASAAELARDVERYLEGMPVEARAPHWGYRANRFVKRHRWAVSAAALAAVVLTVSTGVALSQARLARQRFDQVRALSRSVLFEIYDSVNPLSGSLPARKLIVERGLRYLETLADDRSLDPAVQRDIAEGYLRMAEILGKDVAGASFLRSAGAQESAGKALGVARQLAAAQPRIENQRLLLKALEASAAAARTRGDRESSRAFGEEGVRLAGQLAASNPRDRELQEQWATMLKQLGAIDLESSRKEEGVAAYRRSLAVREKLYQTYGDDPALQRLAEAHGWLASGLYQLRRLEEAERHGLESYRLNLERSRREPRKTRPNLASDLGFLAVMARAKDPARAIGLYQEQLTLRRAIQADEPQSAVAALRVAATLARLGEACGTAGRFREAFRYGEEALRITERLATADPGSVAVKNELLYSLFDLTRSRRLAGEKQSVCALAARAVRLLDQPPPASPEVVRTVSKIRPVAAECQSRAAPPAGQTAKRGQTPNRAVP